MKTSREIFQIEVSQGINISQRSIRRKRTQLVLIQTRSILEMQVCSVYSTALKTSKAISDLLPFNNNRGMSSKTLSKKKKGSSLL